ncbi:unnamed protein product [Adineta steineri]|uniref:Sodium-dependent glucose transporter 1-like protein n=1 Tax=Adineta steineri TaxID=433720 RepID=A0A814T1J4_9BILA|nr:unnamed protein product [Adineta steineri]CAF0847778.1 unnamed protein product [Adineta steineri]CAF1153923.1 unnamed protein product [Adineta steineri]
MIEPASKKIKPTMIMYIRTILLVVSYFLMGVGGEIVGSTMGILAHNTHVTFNGMATALALRSIGSLLGNVFCGIFQKITKSYSDLLLTVAFIFLGLIGAITPFIKSFMLLNIAFFFHGTAGSFASMGGTSLIFKIWGSRAGTPLSMTHFGYGCGAIFINLFVRPFLSNKNVHSNLNISKQFNSTLSRSVSIPIDADIRIPYLTIGVLCFIICIGHFIFFIQEQKDKRNKTEIQQVNYTPVTTISSKTETQYDKTKVSQYSPVICGHGYFGYGLSLSLVFIVYMFFLLGTEQTFAKFYFSYLKFDKFHISTDAASWATILFWISFSSGRLIGAIACIFIPVSICLSGLWCGGLLLAIMWITYVWILGLTTTSLFVLGSFTGLIIGPLLPLSFAWVNQKLNVIPSLLAALLFGSGVGSLTLQKIGGFIMDYDPNHFPTIIITCIILTIMLYMVSNIIIFVHQRNLKNLKHPVNNDASLTIDKVDEEEKQQTTDLLQAVSEI